MAWVRIRSRRDPAFWAPLALAFLAALLLGVTAQLWASDHLRELRTLAEAEPEAAAVAAERMLRALGWWPGVFCWASAALLGRASQLGLREGRLPPGGWWSLGAYRVVSGASAQRLGRLGLALAVLLALLGVAAVLLVDRLAGALLAARAVG